MRRLALCVAVTCLAACRSDATKPGAGTAGSETGATVTDPAVGAIVRVVDGDTVVVEIGGGEETVRLIGVDTPETVKPDSPVECYGPEASALTAELLPEGTVVRLVRDPEPRDAYGRLLAYVYRVEDGMLVNLLLLEAGAATPLSFPPNTTHAERFVAAAAAAERAGVGLWGACGTP